jgi:GTPase SAR1 family protein
LIYRAVKNEFLQGPIKWDNLQITYQTPSGPLDVVRNFSISQIVIMICFKTYFDTAGQERFRTLTSSYYRGCNLALVAVDLTSGDSFFDTERHLQELKRYMSEESPILLVGTKVCNLSFLSTMMQILIATRS